MAKASGYLYVEDIMEICGISISKAYAIIRQLNMELEKEGFITIAGRVPRRKFNEKFYAGEVQEELTVSR